MTHGASLAVMTGLLLACGSSGAAPASTAPGSVEARAAGGARPAATIAKGEAPGGYEGYEGYEIEELALTAQAAMTIRGQAPATELQARLGTAIPRLVAHALASGLELAGPPFVRYHERRLDPGSSPDPIHFEAGVPVLKPGAGTEDIKAVELPAGPAIATVHVGPYQDLPRAHAALASWARARGREAGGPPWEVFLTNPLQEPDPHRWRTKVFLPLKPAKPRPHPG